MTARQGKRDPKAQERADIVQKVREHEERLAQLEALGQRAVACRHWRWMPGMASGWKDGSGDQRVLSVDLETRSYVVDGFGIEYEWDGARLPNLSDPATLGCLLALVREAWSDPTLGLSAARGGRSGRPAGCWHFHGRKPHRRGFGRRFTGDFFFAEASALVAALEAAP